MFCLEVRGGRGKREGAGASRERWAKQCMHILINEKKNLVAEGSRDLDQLVCAAISVYYNRDLEKDKNRTWKRKRERINGRRI
jgi:hypothetical protein